MTPEKIARYREIKNRSDAVGLLSAGAVIAELVEDVLALEKQVAELKANPTVETGTQPINKGGFSKTNPWPHTWTENKRLAPGSNAGAPEPGR